jgi:hypothetical protein
MANPFGSGSAIMMPLSSRVSEHRPESYDAEPASTVRTVDEARPSPVEAPEIVALVARIVAAVTTSEEGLTALELRLAFNERPDRLQRALAAGLRTRRIRRLGSRCQTRYLANR